MQDVGFRVLNRYRVFLMGMVLCVLGMPGIVWGGSPLGFQPDYPMLVIQPESDWGYQIPKAVPQEGLVLCGKASGETRLVPGTYTVQYSGEPQPYSGQVMLSGCDAAQGETAWFLIHDTTKRLKPGAVETVFSAKIQVLEGGWTNLVGETGASVGPRQQVKMIVYEGHRYRFTFIRPNENRYGVTLTGDGMFQTLVSRFDPSGMAPYLGFLWAGDLDQDHKLDFLADFVDGERSMAYMLFLSSFALPGQLVAPVSQYIEPIY